MLTNSYASRVVEIQEKQKVIDTGLYSVVRHPMYMSMILIYTGTSLILGSYIALIPSAMLFVALAFRIINEEEVLKGGLAGYTEYMKRVKYRLIPFVW
jgi:protein-S-isoprenylcysteine O-methyltransferase Ste14